VLEVISSSLVGLFIGFLGREPASLPSLQLLSWQETEIFNLPTQSDPQAEALVQQYIKKLADRGLLADRQGVWIQSEWSELADVRGKIPAPAASLTKIATSLAALSQWNHKHRFETGIYTTGAIDRGILQGDLIVRGDGDPLFVWEEAIALANALQKLGINQIQGNLVIVGNFYLNFKSDTFISGELLKQGFNSSLWSKEVVSQYQKMPPGTAKPQLEIAGAVKISNILPESAKLLIRHQSLTLGEILKQMNIYSNNHIAQMLGSALGDGPVIAQIAAKAARVPQEEIQLINGSGLGVDNRISPRAACAMLMTLQQQLQEQSLSLADIFPVSGFDRKGTMQFRNIPLGTAIKTGTLREVSALAGVIPTKARGPVWFAIVNHGTNIEQLRAEQDNLLQNLSQHWQLEPFSLNFANNDYLGNPARNLL
jgi:D-alanyl-D-alanine carboxypeptidase/D-alanyl-D-alanine-endopeptidase (penicillin-binding protein 4)